MESLIKIVTDGAGWSNVPSPRSLAAVAIPWQVIIPDICALAGNFTESTTGRFHESGNDFLAANALYACDNWQDKLIPSEKLSPILLISFT